AQQLLALLCRSIVPWGALVDTVEYNGRFVAYAVVPERPEDGGLSTTAEGRVYLRRGSRIEEVPLTTTADDSTVSAREGGSLRGFVAMSFHEEQEPALVDYFEAMKRAADQAQCPIELHRIDLKEGDYDITSE